jgi:hypothetical protein
LDRQYHNVDLITYLLAAKQIEMEPDGIVFGNGVFVSKDNRRLGFSASLLEAQDAHTRNAQYRQGVRALLVLSALVFTLDTVRTLPLHFVR